tara:strand:+ start:733 stop:855 length:123 start_codon:yes stop_codon:yes gene_type:complete
MKLKHTYGLRMMEELLYLSFKWPEKMGFIFTIHREDAVIQ